MNIVSSCVDSLLESFEGHPGFTIPTSNYTLNLNHPPPDPEHFQDVLEMLRTRLQSEDESNNASIAAPTKVALLDGMKPPAPHMMTTPIISRWKLRRGTVPRDELSNSFPPLSHDNIGSSTESQEDLLKENSWRNLENLQQESHNSKVTIMDSCPFQNRCENGNRKPNRKPMSMDIPKERTGSVKSVLESPLSFPKPEKLVLDPWYYDNHVRVHPSRHVIEVPQPIGWTEKQQFPPGSRTVTVPRGEKGFGFIMVEQKAREMLVVVVVLSCCCCIVMLLLCCHVVVVLSCCFRHFITNFLLVFTLPPPSFIFLSPDV